MTIATPLMIAVLNGCLEAARQLLERGAEVDARNRFGYTALMLVPATGNAPMAELLLKFGADPQARNHLNWTAARIAELVGDDALAERLRAKPGAGAAFHLDHRKGALKCATS